MSYSLKIVKNYNDFLINEADAKKPPVDKLKIVRDTYTEDQLQKLNKEAFEYLKSAMTTLREDEAFKEMKGIKMILKKAKPMVGLTKEQADALGDQFKNSGEELMFGAEPEHFNTVYIDKKEFKEILEDKEGAALKKEYDDLVAKISEWNTANAKIFKFDDGKGDKVNNPDESNNAITALKTILTGHDKILKSVSIEFIGHTSSTGDNAKNQTLSENRAATVKNLFITAIPEAKNWNVTSIGKGETELLHTDDASDKEKQQLNRRVEVKISAEFTGPKPPEDKITYNCVVYGFILVELEEPNTDKPKTSKSRSYKPKFKKLNPKKLIPCPFGH